VKTYFDSSALIAAMVQEEEHHAAAFKALVDATAGFTSTHALAEIFATLTGGRLDFQLAPNDAFHVIDTNIGHRIRVTELSLGDYRQAMQRSHASGARGGAVFDMLHLEAARRGQAERILTINVRHFQTFAPDIRGIISLP
jgi:predicted nucleic acid-binding protein